MHRGFAAGLVAVALGGCAQLKVTYSSDPPGATLYENGRPLGYTPYTLNYGSSPIESFKRGQCVALTGTSVKWASGAEASATNLTVCPTQGLSQSYIFIRPDVPGREIGQELVRSKQLFGNSIAKKTVDLKPARTE